MNLGMKPDISWTNREQDVSSSGPQGAMDSEGDEHLSAQDLVRAQITFFGW